MNIDEAFPSRFLRAVDLKGKPARFTISAVEVEKMQDGQRKPVLKFESTEKMLVLNKTNSTKISQALGKDTDKWIDRQVILYPTTVEFSGQEVEAIRVRMPELQAKPRPKEQQVVIDEDDERTIGRKPAGFDERNPPPPSGVGSDMDDEIPF